ncbi:MAG: SUMF1/EgtB/PvdO family nonheme iron enzyme, partial [Fibrobacteria bacterium]
ISSDAKLASVIVLSQASKDTVVFVFGESGFKQDTLRHGEQKIILIDSLQRAEEISGRLVFGLVPVYSGDATPGKPPITYFNTTDKDPPDPFHPRIEAGSRQISVAWERPSDRTNFFNLSQDTGLIRSYVLGLKLDGRADVDRKRAFRPSVISYFVGGKDMKISVRDSLDNDTLPISFTLTLPDSNRSAKRGAPIAADSLYLVIGNLHPQDSLTVSLYAVDSSGNENKNAMEVVLVRTTDTTQPSKPELTVDSIGRNRFIAQWKSSRDSVESDGAIREGLTPNYQIQKYLFTRTLQRGPGEKTTTLDRMDTTIVPEAKDSTLESFTLPLDFLPPGTTFHLSVTAVDLSGFESDPDTLTVSTQAIRFAGDDSTLSCPPGFIPIPRGKFNLGDNSSAADADEKGPLAVTMESYCIEPYEHRDSSSNRFISNITYEDAVKACADIDSTFFETRLCSEAEWERSCEGPSDSPALLHGILSEAGNPSILQTSCNQSTNDSAMAMSFNLRNSVCLATEGVFDMAGNLSEWVRDPYVPNAYSGLNDSVLSHGFAFNDSALASATPDYIRRHSLRGGNYLKTNLPLLSSTQNLARCSNRDFAEQVRPKYREDCMDSTKQKIAVIYGPGLTGHRCIAVPDTIEPAAITDIIPSPSDTSGQTLLIFVAGKPTGIRDSILPVDSAFRGRKPISAQLTRKSLAIVNFQNVANPDSTIPDTLDANEMKDTTLATLDKIFRREAGNASWQVQKDEAGRYLIKYLYAYTILGSKPALEYYSSRAIGFRCCSLAKAAAVPPPVATTTAR